MEQTQPASSGPLNDLDSVAAAMERFSARPTATEEPAKAAPAAEEVEEAEAAAEGVEAEEPEATEEPSEAEADTESDPDVELRLDEAGNPVTVKLSELRKGYLRQSDYTRKTQELAEGRRAVEQAAQQIATQRQQMAQEYGATLNQLRSMLPQDDSAELAELERTDPGEWSRRMFRKQQEQQMVAMARQRMEQLEQQDRLARVQQEAAELANKVPEWKDRSRAQKDLSELERFACEAYGFTPEILGNVVDHRFVLMVRDAKKGREATRKAAELKPVLKALPKVQRPGSAGAATATGADDFKRSMQRLQKTGGRNIDDIAAAFAASEKIRRR